MSADAYSSCPCGSGKKLKFCCGAYWPEIEKIEKLYDSQQDVTALDAIERLEAKLPSHPYLLNMKIDVLFALGRREEADAVREKLTTEHPDNAHARFHQAAHSAELGDLSKGLREFYSAFAASPQGEVAGTGLMAGRALSTAALMQRAFVAGRTLLNILAALTPNDQELRRAILSWMGVDEQPLLLRELPQLAQVPAGAACAAEYETAMEPGGRGDFPTSEERFAQLAAKYPGEAAIWESLAAIRSLLADAPGAATAYGKLAEVTKDWDDAVEAEAKSLLYRQDLTGEVVEVLRATYEVQDVDRVIELLAGDRRAVRIPDQAIPHEEGTPPPKAMYTLLDRPQLRGGEPLKLEEVPSSTGGVFIFGRETDRPARFVIESFGPAELEKAITQLRETTREPLPAIGEREIAGSLLAERYAMSWRPQVPPETTADEYFQLRGAWQRKAMQEIWPNTKSHLLDGKTPNEAKADPAMKRRVAAVVLLAEFEYDDILTHEDLNQLRETLGLPIAGDIDPTTFQASGAPAEVPLVRLHRVDASKYSDEALTRQMQRAELHRAVGAMLRLGAEAVRRTSLSAAQRASVHGAMAMAGNDPSASIGHLKEAQRLSAEAKKSPAQFLLMELRLRFQRREAQDIERLLKTLMSKHGREPGVQQALASILQEMGLMNAGGLPPQAAAEPSLVMPGGSEESGKLWTPESASGPAKSALWVPGME